MPLKPPELKVANSLYNLARAKGLAPNRAREFVAAAYAESNLNPHATNKSSGAAGLFQLLSSGYRQKAQKLGGLYDPTANASAILPDYQSYWAKNPGAIPGAAARDVERSGMGAGFYSKPLGLIPQFGGATAGPPVQTLPFNPARPLRPAPLPAVKGQTVNLLPLLKILGLGDIPGIGELASFTTPGRPGRQAPLPKIPRQVMPTTAPTSFAVPVKKLAKGQAILTSTADRAGVRTQKPVLQFVKAVSALYGAPLKIGTGTNHNRLTVNGNVSDHWVGNASDIPASGPSLTKMGRAALVAAGMDPRKAATINGGLFNLYRGGYRYQIIFNTTEGGNHWNHLHVGVRRA